MNVCFLHPYYIFLSKQYVTMKFRTDWTKNFTYFHFWHKKNHTLSQELFVLFTQIKITAFQVIIEENFSRWTFQHFYVKLLHILKCSIEICEQYNITISILHILEDYADQAALGLLHSFMHDFGTIYDRS